MNNSIENLYKKTNQETSPTTLDNLILQQAKQSCELNKAQKIRRWMYPLATAAVFVMGFSVIFNLQNLNQELQTEPNIIDTTRKFEVELIPTDDAPLEPHSRNPSVSRANKQKPAKLKAIVAEAIAENEELRLKDSIKGSINEYNSSNKEQLSTPQLEIVAPIAEGNNLLRDIAKRERTNQAGNKKTDNLQETLVPIAVAEKKQVIKAIKITDGELGLSRNSDDSQVQDYKLDKVVVTGSRIITRNIETPAGITKLEKLIAKKRFTKAKKLLKKLKLKYPDYDFSRLEKLLKMYNY